MKLPLMIASALCGAALGCSSSSPSNEGAKQSSSDAAQPSGDDDAAPVDTGDDATTNPTKGSPDGSTGPVVPADAGASLSDAGVVLGKDGATVEDFSAQASDFVCLKDWTQVNNYRIVNKLGHMSEALAVANSPDGGVFPVGTIISLIPGEASVKRGAGYSAATHDWEFFTLNASASGTTITAQGTTAVSNALGTCIGCHGQAAPQWDLVCGDTHGCPSLILDGAQIAAAQQTDPRCP
jgi:hypothetical protein